MMLLDRLDQILGQCTIRGTVHTSITGVTDVVGNVMPGMMYIAIHGTKFDGHSCIAEAIRKGASAVCVQTGSNYEPHNDWQGAWVEVPDTRLALAVLAKNVSASVRHAVDSLVWIGVTGTNGKTTVANLIVTMLRKCNVRAACIGTIGVDYVDASGKPILRPTGYTTPHAPVLYDLAVEFVKNGITHVVMEVSSHALHQHRVAGISYAVAVFTNLTHDHLDYHGTMENYAMAKQKLFTGLPRTSWAVISTVGPDHETMVQHCRAHVELVRIGNIRADREGSAFTVQSRSDRFYSAHHLHTTLLGDFNAVNVGLAFRAVTHLTPKTDVLEEIASNLKPPPGRLEQIQLPNGSVAVVDYAHTPDALEKALQTLRPLTNHLVVVFGCGGNRDATKRGLMGRIAEQQADVVIITSDNPRDEDPLAIIDDVRSGMASANKAHVEPDRERAIRYALRISGSESIILIAGKGHEAYQEVAGLKMPFSDRDVVRNSINPETV